MMTIKFTIMVTHKMAKLLKIMIKIYKIIKNNDNGIKYFTDLYHILIVIQYILKIIQCKLY